jgi:hypothetical protein
MSHNEFKISEPIAPQEASPMKHEMHVLGIDIAKRLFHAVGVTDCNRNQPGLQSAHFQDHILCIYPPPQDRITCD